MSSQHANLLSASAHLAPGHVLGGSSGDPLWQRLQQWSPRAEAQARGFARTLSQRLCQRHGWRPAYAERAVAEYRRFMWLLVQRRGALCPSEAVDAVWHEHLLDSQTCFEYFCPQVLGQTMHHVPARGGQGELHRQRYRDTLRAYAQAFGQPPADIWPAPDQRWAAMPGPRQAKAAEGGGGCGGYYSGCSDSGCSDSGCSGGGCGGCGG